MIFVGKYCVLISGKRVSNDDLLIDELKKNMTVLKNSNNSGIESIVYNRKVDLILLEISQDVASEVEIVKNIKFKFSNIKIIVINGNREMISRSLSYGANDVFRSPYKRHLVVERTKAMLDKK